MKIALILFSDGWGGAESVVHELARAIRGKGEEVVLIINHEIERYYEDLPEVSLFNIGPLHDTAHMAHVLMRRGGDLDGNPPSTGFLGHTFKNALRLLRRRSISSMVRKILVDEHVDLVSLHLEDTFKLHDAAIKPLGIPAVITLHSPFLGVDSSRTFDPLTIMRRRFLTRVLCSIDGLTYQSAAEIHSLSFLTSQTRYTSARIPNGVDVEALRRVAGSALAGKRSKLVYLGGSRWQKGGLLAVQTMYLLKCEGSLELHMLGRIPTDHAIRRLVQELDLEDDIHFHDFVPVPKVYDYLNSADVVIIPSLSEGFSVTAIEAMALGKPIVATNVGGIPTAIKDGRNAILVPPDPRHLAEAVRQLVWDPERRENMARTNREDARSYDWALISDQYLAYFKEVAGGSSSRLPQGSSLPPIKDSRQYPQQPAP